MCPDGDPRVRMTSAGADTDLAPLVMSALARDAIAFLADPDSRRLATYNAPRCVRYFLKEHGHQECCKASCTTAPVRHAITSAIILHQILHKSCIVDLS